MSIGDWFSLVDGATFVLIVCLLNLLPLAYELSLHALVWCGVDVTAFSHLNQVTRCVDALTGLGERGLLLTVALFIGTPIYLHVTAFYPFFANESTWEMWVYHVLPSLWLNTNMVIYWLYAMLTKPITTKDLPETRNLRLPKGVMTRLQARYDVRFGDLPGAELKRALAREDIRFCAECRRTKPDGTHHCSTCETCVVGMDHHCPFLVQCVGERNYRYFFLWVLYCGLSSVYAAVLTWPAYHLCTFEVTSAEAEAGHDHPDHDDGATVMHGPTADLDVLCEALGDKNRKLFFVALFASIVLGGMSVFLCYLVATGGTLMNAFGSFLGGGEMGRDSDDEDEQAGLAGARRRRGERRIRNPKLAAFYQKRKRVTAVFGPPWLWFIHLSPFLEMGYNAFASLRGSHAARSTTVLGDTHLI